MPSAAARALTGVGSATVGLVITREPAVLGIEPFFMAFVAGIEEVLSAHGYALLLQVTPCPAQEESVRSSVPVLVDRGSIGAPPG